MIDILKLVNAAVASKDMVPVLTHFCVYADLIDGRGRIQGSNGIVHIDAPFDYQIAQCAVPAQRFIKSVEACDSQPEFGLTPAGKLSIKKGRFKAYLPLLDCASYPRAALHGEKLELLPGLLESIKRLKPFISEDASRPWSQSVLLREGFMYATNNVILARTPYAWANASLVLPVALVDRLLDINQDPDGCYLDGQAVSFTYGDIWLRSTLLKLEWPAIERYIPEPANEPVPEELMHAVTKIKDLGENEKFPVINVGLAVSTDDGEAGAQFDGFDLPQAKFHADQLMKILPLATHINFSGYPGACAWRGNNLEGIIVGLKTQ